MMETLEEFQQFLKLGEKSAATRKNYARSVRRFLRERGEEFSREALLEYREQLKAVYGGSTVNSHIAALNAYLKFRGSDWRLGFVKIQRKPYIQADRELELEEYERLLEACRGNERMYLLLQTLCSTGMRISELRYIHAENLPDGEITVDCKGKLREIFLPDLLVCRLEEYCRKRKILRGEIFVTRTGKPLNRSNIWRSMKRLCRKAEVPKTKVYPHSFRHLFARTYYEKEKDLSKLADLLGHSSVETTRIYLLTNGERHREQINSLGLVK